MHCLHCGKEIWFFVGFFDRDFCKPSHRRKYHQRLRTALDEGPMEAPADIAGYARRIAPQTRGGVALPLCRSTATTRAFCWPEASILEPASTLTSTACVCGATAFAAPSASAGLPEIRWRSETAAPPTVRQLPRLRSLFPTSGVLFPAL